MQLNAIEQAIAIASTIGTLLDMYTDRQSGAIQEVRRVQTRFMRQRAKTNRKEFIRAVTVADQVWRDTIVRFENEKRPIELLTSCMRLYDVYEHELSKYALITQKRMEKMLINVAEHTSEEIEKSSFDVIDFLINQYFPYTGKRRMTLKEKMELKHGIPHAIDDMQER